MPSESTKLGLMSEQPDTIWNAATTKKPEGRGCQEIFAITWQSSPARKLTSNRELLIQTMSCARMCWLELIPTLSEKATRDPLSSNEDLLTVTPLLSEMPSADPHGLSLKETERGCNHLIWRGV